VFLLSVNAMLDEYGWKSNVLNDVNECRQCLQRLVTRVQFSCSFADLDLDTVDRGGSVAEWLAALSAMDSGAVGPAGMGSNRSRDAVG